MTGPEPVGPDARPDPRLGDTAHLLRVVARITEPVAQDLRARAHELAGRLAPHARSVRVRVLIALHPARALDHGSAHLALRAGFPDPEVDDLLAGVLRDPLALTGERLPHQVLEQAWLRSLLDGQSPAPLVRSTALGTGTDALAGTADDARAFARAARWATDTGAVPPALGRPVGNVLAEALSMLARALDDGDLDLAAELVLVWPCLGAPLDPVSRFALDLVVAVQDEADGDSGPSRRTDLLLGVVSATLLAAEPGDVRMAARQACAARTVRQARAGSAAGCLDSLFRLIGEPPDAPRWQRHADRLPRPELAALAPLLVDVALVRAARRFDVGTVSSTLSLVVDHGLPVTPAAQQASGMLRRLAAL